jgi:hypothetical protein
MGYADHGATRQDPPVSLKPIIRKALAAPAAARYALMRELRAHLDRRAHRNDRRR